MENSQANTAPGELGQEIHILEGENFLVCSKTGDVPTPGAYGLFHRDTRFLSKYLLLLNGQSLSTITSRQTDYFTASFFLSNQKDKIAAEKTISVLRRHVIDDALFEEFSLENHNNQPIEVTLSFEYEVDFADLFEVKSQMKRSRRSIEVQPAKDGTSVQFTYNHKNIFRQTRIGFSKSGILDAKKATFKLTVPAKGKWNLSVRMDTSTDASVKTVDKPTSNFSSSQDEMQKSQQKWENQVPELRTNHEYLSRSYHRSCIDLASLQINALSLKGDAPLLAAGLPWFMTLFGRDSLIASYQSIILGTSLAERALRALAKQQATDINDFCDRQPGKILHEVRHGELTELGELPYSPYFGSIDSTMLFLVMVSEVYRWTAKSEFLTEMQTAVTNALDWIEKYGDLDGDGYVEYKTKSSKGLRNQGWKDSGDGIQFFDGQLAEPPIALSEVQGYVYDAYLRCSEIFTVLGDQQKAKDFDRKARELKQRFNTDFWSTARKIFVLGLDKDKRQIDSVCSNMGQLLWSGIVDADKAAPVVATLMSEPMYSGWGIRTLSSECGGFNPIGYHLGTVWPHDNSIIAAGLVKYGFAEEAMRIIEDMLDAAAAFEFRLPETFAGYNRGGLKFPARYPTSCSPQAWASGAPLLFLRTLLNLQPDVSQQKLTIDPHLPKSISRLSLDGVPAYGKLFSIKVEPGTVEIS